MAKPERKYEDGWYRLETPRYVAAVQVVKGKVAQAAPICRWMVGRDFESCLWGGGHNLDGTKVLKMNV
jgi:hypothetical protein